MKIRYVMIILLLLLLAGVVSAWLPDYQYRKSHHIDGSITGDQTNYPVMIVVHRSSGIDTERNVYVQTKCKEDYSDIRYTLGDDTVLDYWIAGSNSTEATMWVEVPSIPSSGGADIYIYYGNSGATAYSNGDATFLFFDHFDNPSGSLNTSKWNTGGSPTIVVSNSEMTLSGGGSTFRGIITTGQYGVNTAIHTRSRRAGTGAHYEYLGYDTSATLTGNNEIYLSDSSGNYVLYTKASGTGSSAPSLGGTDTPYHVLNIIRKSTTNVMAYKQSWLLADKTSNIPTGNLNVILSEYDGSWVTDWIFVRKYISPEPLQTTWGSEEEFNTPNIIMPNEMPFRITPELVAQAGPHFFIGGDWTGNASNIYAVSIETSDVVLHGNDYTLTGTLDTDGMTYQGAIVVSNQKNVTVSQVNATNWNVGIGYDNVTSGWIDQNNLHGNVDSGMGVTRSDGIFISGNTLQNNGHDGLVVVNSTYITVTGENIGGTPGTPGTPFPTLISGNPFGIILHNVTHGYISGYIVPWYSSEEVEVPGEVTQNTINGLQIVQSEDILIRHFTFSENAGGGIYIQQSSNVQTRDCDIVDGNYFGIAMVNVTDSQIEENLIDNNLNHGIYIGDPESGGCSNITIVGNFIGENSETNAQGISATVGRNLTILDNIVANSGKRGINLFSCTNVTVQANQITDHLSPFPDAGNGICIVNTMRANTHDNTLTDNTVGIFYANSTFNYIYNNSINIGNGGGSGTGIALIEGSGITGDARGVSEPPHSVTRNTVTGFETGLYLTNVTDILIFDNYFNNIMNSVIDEGTSNLTWNYTKVLVTSVSNLESNIIGGEYFGGNYWAQPDGNGWSQITADADSDGICDSAYELDLDGNVDLLPLGGFLPVQADFSANPSDAKFNGVDPVIVHFTDNSTGPIDGWIWNFGDGTTSNDENPSHGYTTNGVFEVTLTVHHESVEITNTAGKFIYIRPDSVSGVPIWEGWNFVSTPRKLAEGNNTLCDVFKDVDSGGRNVFYYNATLPEPYWEIVDQDYVIKPLDGIWIYSTRVGPFVPFIYDTNFASSTPRIKHLYPGWNSIGMGSVYPMETMSYLAPLDDKWEMLLEFDSSLQLYFPPQIQGIQTGNMDVGKGYWIYMNEEADLLALTG